MPQSPWWGSSCFFCRWDGACDAARRGGRRSACSSWSLGSLRPILVPCRSLSRKQLERRGLLNRDRGQAIDIHRRTRQTVQHRHREAADATERHGAIEGLVDIQKERVPWLRRAIMRHKARIGRSDPSADSNGALRRGASVEDRDVPRPTGTPGTECPPEPGERGPGPPQFREAGSRPRHRPVSPPPAALA